MKKILLIVALLLIGSPCFAENFCVDNGDTWNSSACASDCTAEVTAGTCMDWSDLDTAANWAASDTSNKIDAGDTVYFSDAGGTFSTSPINCNTHAAGTSSEPIILTVMSGDSVKIDNQTGDSSVFYIDHDYVYFQLGSGTQFWIESDGGIFRIGNAGTTIVDNWLIKEMKLGPSGDSDTSTDMISFKCARSGVIKDNEIGNCTHSSIGHSYCSLVGQDHDYKV